MKLGWVLFFSVSLFAMNANAKGGSEAGNGGNAVALEFYKSAQTALNIYGKVLATYPELKNKKLKQVLDQTQILVSSTPLYVEKDGVRQESTAINFKKPLTIVVHEKKWKKISKDAIREALALHELLGLVDVEKTGNYKISKKYLESTGVQCQKGLCEQDPSSSQEEIYCRFLNNWYPDDKGRFRYSCSDKGHDFIIWCDLFIDPLEFGSNKLDILGGVWTQRSESSGLLVSSDIVNGAVMCETR